MIDNKKNIHNFDFLNELLKKPAWNLIFPKSIEPLFQSHYSSTFLFQMRGSVIAGFLLLTVCCILDLFYAPRIEWLPLYQTILLMLVMIIIGVFAFSDAFKGNEQKTLIVFVSLLFSAMTWMAYKLEAPFEGLYYNGIVLIELFIVTVARIQFNACFFLLLIFYFIYNIVLSIDDKHHHYMILMHNYIYITAAILGLFGNYFLEKNIRATFLKQALTRLEHQYIERKQRKLHESLKSDALTMLANHRYFHEQLEMEWRRALRHQYPLTLMMVDIDALSQFNKIHGQQKGDLLLQQLAAIFKHMGRRPGDIVSRYGGDEFAMLFVGTDRQGAISLVSAMRKSLAQHLLMNEDNNNVTLSFGACAMVPKRTQTYDILLKKADKALYEAKTNGGDGFVVFS